jgi:hypothetical protein
MTHRSDSRFSVVGSDKVSPVSLASAVAKHFDHPDFNRCRLGHSLFTLFE